MLSLIDTNFVKNSLSFWNQLSFEEQNLILNNTKVVKYNQSQVVYNSQVECVGIILVKTGILRTYLLSELGKEITLYRLYNDSICILSASCLLKNINFDVHITSEVETEILLINSSIFSKIIENNIYAENFSYKMAAMRFSDVMWAFEQILFMSFDKRLAIFILDELSKSKEDVINLTHEEIAKYMGSAREVVSRMMKYFQNENLVQLSRGSVKVLNKEKLKKIAT